MNLMKSINFEFVRPNRPVLADLGGFAESYMHSDASGALVKLRLLLEECVETIYQRFRLGRPYGREPRLDDLIDADDFARAVNGTMRSKLHALRQSCNHGAHRSGLYTITLQRVLEAARLAHDIVRWMFEFVGWGSSAGLPLWVDPPAGGAAEATKGRLQQEKKEALQQVREKEDALTRALKDLASEREAQAQILKNLTRTQEELEALRKRAEEVSNALGYNERDTRKYLIDGMLADAGWRLDERARVTVELRAPPDGIADYVLWDESGLPLAVVEAKRAGIDPTVGFTQAQGYADALEAKHGRRPVLYCTNGIETWLMDDRSDRSPRRVYGFHERKSLERLVHRRGLAPLTTYAPKAGIADRIYQIEAVKRVLARFDEGSRRALIVQATGTGKTRVAVSLCETLMRAQRAQRILFLCDRRALRDQADQAFNELLPNEPRMVLGVEAAEGEGNKNSSVPKTGASVEKNLHEQRIYLATYPTMMRLRERYDVGFFDLIIADESHRSIYNKYRDLFLYFDALQVGLTATPVGYIDHNTYTLFNCGDQDPTFHYEYDAAVEDGHLVPYNPVAHDTHFLRQGVRWDEMTDAQRARIEASEDDPKAIDYDADQIDRQVMVTGTARAMFSVLMEKGLRDASQSRPGKTVIFARSHKHAMFLAGVFEKQFPEFPKDFCKVIDNHDPRADRLIARFKKLDDVLTLAISVDMLDTGIDVPEIVNLVFARPVRSLVKFLQMLGRGTRLCKNLYGPGKHKTEFVVIDHWHNFEHFSIRRAAREMALSTPLRERIFLARIDVVTAALQRNDTDSFNRALRLVAEDLNALLSSPSLSVRDQHGALAPLCEPERLQQWSTETRAGLRSVAAKLMRWIDVRDEELAALRFDLMIAELELSMLEESSLREAHQGRIARVLAKLPRNLGQVVAKASLLDAVASPGYWSASTTEGTERLRSELRELMALIDDKVAAEPVRVLDLEDHGAQTTAVAPLMLGEQELKPYRARVRQVLEQHFDENPTLRKIKRGEAVREADLDELARLVLKVDPSVNLRYLPTRLNAQGGLHRVLRGIVGMDREAIEAAFQGYVAQHPELTAQQLQFLQMVKQHIRVNGGIEINELYQAPFTAMSADGVEGVFRNDRQIDDLLRLLGPFSLEAS